MTARVIDDFTTPWQADASGLWSTSSTDAAAHPPSRGRGMEIKAVAGSAAPPSPFAERRFTPALDLTGADELRLWLSSSRLGDGEPARPHYLAFEADADPPASGGPWRRLLPVTQARRWELHALWLADMPTTTRSAAAVLRLRGLAPQLAFSAAVDELVATRPQPLTDAEAAIRARLDKVHFLDVAGTPTAVPAIVELPENPPERAAPYILIRQRRILPLARAASSPLVVDNHTEAGAFMRPAPTTVQLDYEIDAFVDQAVHRTELFEAIARGFAADPLLVVDGAVVEVRTLEVDIEPAQVRAPLFYRLEVTVETGRRRFGETAAPFVLAGGLDDRSAEEVRV